RRAWKLFSNAERNRIATARADESLRERARESARSAQRASTTVLPTMAPRDGFAIEAGGSRNRIGAAFHRWTASRIIDMTPNRESSEKITTTNALDDVMRRSLLPRRVRRAVIAAGITAFAIDRRPAAH